MMKRKSLPRKAKEQRERVPVKPMTQAVQVARQKMIRAGDAKAKQSRTGK